MRNFKNLLPLLFVVMVIFVLGIPGSVTAKKWRSGHPAPPGTPFDMAHTKFIDLVKENKILRQRIGHLEERITSLEEVS